MQQRTFNITSHQGSVLTKVSFQNLFGHDEDTSIRQGGMGWCIDKNGSGERKYIFCLRDTSHYMSLTYIIRLRTRFVPDPTEAHKVLSYFDPLNLCHSP